MCYELPQLKLSRRSNLSLYLHTEYTIYIVYIEEKLERRKTVKKYTRMRANNLSPRCSKQWKQEREYPHPSPFPQYAMRSDSTATRQTEDRWQTTLTKPTVAFFAHFYSHLFIRKYFKQLKHATSFPLLSSSLLRVVVFFFFFFFSEKNIRIFPSYSTY